MTTSRINSIVGSLNVITGGGSGLGKATLEWFLKKGSGPILAIDRFYEPDYMDKLDLSPELKSKLSLKTCDTFDESKVEEGLSEFVNTHGTIDNVINVAGVSLAFALYSKTKQDVYNIDHSKSLMKFNTVGTFNLIRLASRYMIESNLKEKSNKRPKCIVNTSSISSQYPSIGQTSYAASTAAIDSMTLCIARELSPFNIRCNTINVGYFDTKLMGEEDRIKNYIASEVAVCPERLGRPEEFAHFVQAIIENEMINGCCVKIDAASREVV